MIHWRVKDKFKGTGSNKKLFDLTNNGRFARHLMVLAILVMIAM